jgi:D-amino peptidase
MTAEATAAVEGACDGGATRAVVNDGHGDMQNILAHALDPRAELILGGPKVPEGQMQGLDRSFAVSFLIGYHAHAGTQSSALDHTMSGDSFGDVWVNGDRWSEADISAAIAGQLGVPVGLFSGDELACAQALERHPTWLTVITKWSYGHSVARSLHPAVACQKIREAAVEAMSPTRASDLFVPTGPFEVKLDLLNTGMTDVCALLPGCERVGPRSVSYVCDEPITIRRCLKTWSILAQQA